MKTEIQKLIENLLEEIQELKSADQNNYTKGYRQGLIKAANLLEASLDAEQKAIEVSYDMAIFDVAEKMVDQSDKFLSGQEYFSTTYKK